MKEFKTPPMKASAAFHITVAIALGLLQILGLAALLGKA